MKISGATYFVAEWYHTSLRNAVLFPFSLYGDAGVDTGTGVL